MVAASTVYVLMEVRGSSEKTELPLDRVCGAGAEALGSPGSVRRTSGITATGFVFWAAPTASVALLWKMSVR